MEQRGETWINMHNHGATWFNMEACGGAKKKMERPKSMMDPTMDGLWSAVEAPV
jgi:hypothetical protein